MLKRPKRRIRYGLLVAAWSAIVLTILCLVPASLPVTAERETQRRSSQDVLASTVSGESDEPSRRPRDNDAGAGGGFFLPIDVMLPGMRAAQRPEEEGEEEDESGLIEERIRFYKRRHGQSTPERKLRLVRDEYRKREREKRQLAENAQLEAVSNWVSAGPTNGAGRLSCIAVHPTATGTLYVGADGGGVWKTTDGGNTWANLTDSINNLNVGAIGIAPSSPNVVYVGTGSEHDSGIGLLKSTDGGNTWVLPASVVADRFFQISVHPNNSNELVIATQQGAFRSTDGGANWANVMSQSSFGEITDLVRDPSNPQILYAAARCFGACNTTVLKSFDGGVNWVNKGSGLPSSSSTQTVFNMKLAISPSSPSTLYLSTSISDFNANLSHVYKTTNGGDSWVDLPGVYASSDPSVNDFLRQADHDNTIVVSPTNPNVVIAAGVSYVRTTDGGNTWSRPPLQPDFKAIYGVHPDATDLRYQGSVLYIANDGGIFKTPDNGETASVLNNNLVVREYYALFSDASSASRTFAGSQDNGTDRRPASGGTSWANVFGGDGFDSASNPLSPSTAYFTYQLGGVVRTRDADETDPFIENITPPYGQDELVSFYTSLTMDLNAPSTLYTASYRVWKTANGGDSWTPLPTTTTDGSTWDTSSTVEKIAVARSNSSVLMVAKGFASVFRSTNGGASWFATTNGLPAFSSINALEIDPHNPNVAYLALYDFSAPGRTVYMTANGGASWVPRGSGLPDAPSVALSVRVDPLDSNVLYCGTSVGVYRSTNQGASWEKFGLGLPSINVEDMRVSDDGSVLRIATYGRGVWEFQLRATQTYTLTVASSNPASGVNVAVSPNDNGGLGNGSTQFTRTYNNTTTVTLTAPSTASGNSFQKWQRDGADVTTNPTASVTMDANHTMTAAYSATTGTSGLQYYPLPRPVRLLDTRAGESACNAPGAPISANTSRKQVATSTCGGLNIPSTAKAVVGNAAVVNTLSGAGSGHLTLYPSGVAKPVAANVNYKPGDIVSNGFTVGLGADGAFNVYAYSTLHVVVDITGYYAPPGAGGLYYHPLPKPVRLLDTRVGQSACDAPGAPIQGNTSRNETARTTCSGLVLPNDMKAIVGNAAVVNTLPGSGAGYVTLYPGGVAKPVSANVNYVPGQVVSNAFTVGLGTDGTFNIYAYTSLHVVVDVTGYYSASAATDANGVAGMLYYPLATTMRLLDTRAGETACVNPGAPLSGNATRTQNARLTCGALTVPSGAKAVVGNAAVVNTLNGSGSGHVVLYPSGVARPLAANVNYTPGQVVSNAFTVGLGADGAFNIYTYSSLHFVADISGYFAP